MTAGASSIPTECRGMLRRAVETVGDDARAASFGELGYVGPLRVFSPRECGRILARLQRQKRPPLDWNKGWAVTSPEYYALGVEDRILELVTGLIGEDVLLWGASLVSRAPGGTHPWHTDIESSSPTATTVSVWIGLARTDLRSSLKVVPFSHRFGLTLQEVMQANGRCRPSVTDDDVARWARERERRSGVATMQVRDGEAIVLDGRLWHGSHNRRRWGTRHALLLQYATPETAIRIPNLDRLEWPFELHTTPRPPCIVVSGRDRHAVNRTVPGPTPGDAEPPILTCRIHPLELPLQQDAHVGWKPHSLFRGATPDIASMRCHVSVLDPARQPHPPHRHDEEEILLVLDGEADLVVQDNPAHEGIVRRTRVGRDTFAYYPSGFAHTIDNTSRSPVTYVMFKWKTDRKERGSFLDGRVVPLSPAYAEVARNSASGMSGTRVLDGETRYLRHLHAHITRLEPGAGYAPHVDSYDVAIVVLDGVVETLGDQAHRNTVIFYAAGESHGMRNVADVPAIYVVFEFHGRHSTSHRLRDQRVSQRLRRAARRASRVLTRGRSQLVPSRLRPRARS